MNEASFEKNGLFFLPPPPTCKFLYLKLLFTLSDCHENWHVEEKGGGEEKEPKNDKNVRLASEKNQQVVLRPKKNSFFPVPIPFVFFRKLTLKMSI